MAIIDINQLSWQRDNRWILKDIDWTVSKGEHWAIIGANGAGKTALLNIINGYTWPTTGDVTILGQPFGKTDLRELRKSIGWVSSALFERFFRFRMSEPSLNVVLSGRHASIGVYERTTEAEKERAFELLSLFRADHLANRPFRLLSHGEKQRILLARAWMAKPRLLILDEPCTGLDMLAREHLLRDVQSLGDQPDSPTMLYVSHHVEEIVPLFTHVLLLKDGRVLASGEKEKTLTAQRLSELFDINVEMTWQDGRPWAKLARTASLT